MEITPSIEPTADGSQTLRHPLSGEAYHSLNGAFTESEHVFIRNGLEACVLNLTSGGKPMRILEVGFGSGLNALLTLRAYLHSPRTAAPDECDTPLVHRVPAVHYTAVELYPVSPVTVAEMELAADEHFMELHAAPWGIPHTIADGFTLHKIEADLADLIFETTFDLVYFDAFAPDAQPELWTAAVFGRIFDAMAPGAILVTYSAKGDVKRALRNVGFAVERLPGAPGKRHMLRAVKPRG